MDQNLVLFIALLVFLYVGCTLWICKVRRKMRHTSSSARERRARREALRTALLNQENTAEHRIDAATRDASDGIEWCSYCEFANFKRLRYCALCGERLKLTFDMLYGDVRPSTRLQRARRRKEWARRLDVKGNAFWYRASNIPSKSLLVRGYVVRFPSTGLVATETQTNSQKAQRSHIVRRLNDDIQASKLEFLDASNADSSIFPDGRSTDLLKEHRDILQLAEKEFPTKFSHFVVSSTAQLVPADREVVKISLHRDFIVEESVDNLTCIELQHIKSAIRITFLEESGVDAGGIHREWFMLLSEMLVNPTVGLFRCTNDVDQTYYLNPNSAVDNGPDHLAYYYATGRLVGRALLVGDVVSFHFCTPLLKLFLGIPVGFDDLESVDPIAFKNLMWLLENDGVQSLGLDFTMTESASDGIVRTVELIPGGKSIDVTDSNKHKYLERRLHYTLFESVSVQLQALLKGFYEVVPQHLLMLFDSEEFDFVLCGSQDIDVSEWEKHSQCSPNLVGSRVLRWFWEIVRDMPNEYRRRLLQFATGCSRVPLAGFEGLTSHDGRICPFMLKGISYHKSQYIRSHACFNRLDLPMYPTRDEMKTVMYGILDTDIQGFTIA